MRKRMKLETKYCQLSSMKMAYNELGHGDPLILIHPNSSSKEIWCRMQTEQFEGYHTYAIDLRCHGESESEDNTLNYKISGADVLEFCHVMGLEQCKVVGYSDGAIIILYLGMTDPSYFDKMVAISPNLTGDSITSGWRFLMNVMILMTKFSYKLTGKNKHKLLRAEMMLHDNYLEKPLLKKITEQLLIIYADKDICYPSHFEEMKTLIPKAHFFKVDNSSHISILNKKATKKAIDEFFNRKITE